MSNEKLENFQNFFEIVKFVRKSKKLTLQAVSTETGISIGHLSDYENGKTGMESEKLFSVCRYLGIPVHGNLAALRQYLEQIGAESESSFIIQGVVTKDLSMEDMPKEDLPPPDLYRFSRIKTPERGMASPHVSKEKNQLRGGMAGPARTARGKSVGLNKEGGMAPDIDSPIYPAEPGGPPIFTANDMQILKLLKGEPEKYLAAIELLRLNNEEVFKLRVEMKDMEKKREDS